MVVLVLRPLLQVRVLLVLAVVVLARWAERLVLVALAVAVLAVWWTLLVLMERQTQAVAVVVLPVIVKAVAREVRVLLFLRLRPKP